MNNSNVHDHYYERHDASFISGGMSETVLGVIHEFASIYHGIMVI